MTGSVGPLRGVQVIEFASLGPGPFTGMLLSDMGADVLQIVRPGTPDPAAWRTDARGRRSLRLDLKRPESIAVCLDLCDTADIV